MTKPIGRALERAVLAAMPAAMSHEASSAGGAVVVADLSEPPSPALAQAASSARKLLAGPIRYTTAGGDDVVLRPDPLTATPAVRAEAARRAAAVARLLEPAPPETSRRWLLSLAALLERMPPADELDAKVRALVGALDLPACCYTAESLRAAGKAIRWFPGLSTVVEKLEPFASPLRAELAALRAVEAAKDAPPEEPPAPPTVKTEEEVAAVRAAAAAFRAERASQAPPPRPRPGHLSGADLEAVRASARRARGWA